MSSPGNTGRIQRPLTRVARRILFERGLDQQIEDDLPYISSIDLAHVLMLAEENIIQAGAAQRLLKRIMTLREQHFVPLKSRSSLRGLFLLYENYLIEAEGARIGGLLQTARSRNDLNATLVRLKLRQPYVQVLNSIFRLQAVLLRKAGLHAAVVMPAYTHGQPAEPITYGHYLAGAAAAISRDLEALIYAARDIDTSPLGAGTVAGTAVPINAARTADLLGFRSCRLNSVDAVASRDVVLHLLAGAAIFGTTLSRIATDLLQWLTHEFHFLWLPDELVGSSSAMPQKRNPFLLEHVQGRTASALGAFVTAVGATHSAPFTNTIACGTESVRPLWGALNDIADAATLLRLVVSQARPCPDRMLRRAAEGFVNATALATRMALEQNIDFRSAHYLVGKAVTEAMARGLVSLDQPASSDAAGVGNVAGDWDPASCVVRAKYGGGPSPENLKAAIVRLRENWLDQYHVISRQRARWAAASRGLEQSVRDFFSGQQTHQHHQPAVCAGK
ncbi:MAG TPA: argininosuccinate lyase [Candidatus Angelobacter sp.]